VSSIRLYVPQRLSTDAMIEVSASQAHYLGSVMRRTVGDTVRLFNGQDGEWEYSIGAIARAKATLTAVRLLRTQATETDLRLLFAPLKREATDLIVQKATELGVSALLPVTTERTNAGRINLERMHTTTIEAAEQCERLTVPAVFPLRTLECVLDDWTDQIPLFVAMERDQLPPAPAVDGPAALLIGPEGGLGDRDRRSLARHDFVRPISLGPRILRAEPAAIVGLALLQRPVCG
jgi:16S rRNA (uracil1498-N3)-methyltransferase